MHFVVRVMHSDRALSDKCIADGKYKWLCQDWSCPSRDFCGKHFGLSERYAAMQEQRADEALVRPTRGELRCEHFIPATRDHFAESLGQTRVFPNTSQTGSA